MMTRLYAIRDRVAQDCGPLFQARNDGVAMRHYQQFMAEVEKGFCKRTDFVLLYCGDFDTETLKGSFVSPPTEVIFTSDALDTGD